MFVMVRDIFESQLLEMIWREPNLLLTGINFSSKNFITKFTKKNEMIYGIQDYDVCKKLKRSCYTDVVRRVVASVGLYLIVSFFSYYLTKNKTNK